MAVNCDLPHVSSESNFHVVIEIIVTFLPRVFFIVSIEKKIRYEANSDSSGTRGIELVR